MISFNFSPKAGYFVTDKFAEIEKLDDKSMPSIMKHFKANFQGKADMGMVNKIARSL